MKNEIYKFLYNELTDYEKEGVSLSMEGSPASPTQIVEAHMMREDISYMRDYVLDEDGDIKEVCFHHVKLQEKTAAVDTPQSNNKMSK